MQNQTTLSKKIIKTIKSSLVSKYSPSTTKTATKPDFFSLINENPQKNKFIPTESTQISPLKMNLLVNKKPTLLSKNLKILTTSPKVISYNLDKPSNLEESSFLSVRFPLMELSIQPSVNAVSPEKL